MSAELIFALICAAGAIVYGVVSVKWILAKPAGNPRMQEIASAIQEGAQAYLNRQYITIGMAGAVIGAAPLTVLVHAVGWRMSMTIFAVVGLILTVIMWVFLRRSGYFWRDCS